MAKLVVMDLLEVQAPDDGRHIESGSIGWQPGAVVRYLNVLPAGVCWMRISKDVAAREIDVVEIHVKT